MSYLLNAWYVAARSEEIERALFPRQLLERPVVMFRSADGLAHVLDDRCPHRFSPLHLGKLVGDLIQCPYHGLRFDGSGTCVLNPQGPNIDGNRIPARAKVRSYPVIERYGMIWIWPGDPQKADPEKLPEFADWEHAGAQARSSHIRVAANYQLMVDNILDVTHADYIHPGFTDGSMSRGIQEIEDREDTITAKLFMANSRLPPILDPEQKPDGPLMDWWFDARWNAPGVLLVDTVRAPAGHERPRARELPNFHIFTPETKTSTHYFWSVVYPAGQPVVEPLHNYLKKVFEAEDPWILEAQQQRLGEHDLLQLDPVMLYHDGAAVLARRRLESMIKAETQ